MARVTYVVSRLVLKICFRSIALRVPLRFRIDFSTTISCNWPVPSIEGSKRVICFRVAAKETEQIRNDFENSLFQIAIFSLDIIQAKGIINLLLFNNFYPVSSKAKRRIVVYGSVTRYDPQSVASATWLILHLLT